MERLDSRSDAMSSPAVDIGSAVGADTPPVRLLAVCTVDVMAWKLLRPWFRALADAGYEVHIACSRENWFDHLAADGFHMHDVPLRRRINPFVHIAALWELFRRKLDHMLETPGIHHCAEPLVERFGNSATGRFDS